MSWSVIALPVPWAAPACHCASATGSLNDYLFQVIGILHSQPPAVLIPVQTDDSLFLPLAGMRRIVDGPQISSVIARAAAEQNMETVASDLTGALKSTLRGREVEVQIPQQMIDA